MSEPVKTIPKRIELEQLAFATDISRNEEFTVPLVGVAREFVIETMTESYDKLKSLEVEKKTYMAQYTATKKDLQAKVEAANDNLSRGELRQVGDLHTILFPHLRMAGLFDSGGLLVRERPMRASEYQTNLNVMALEAGSSIMDPRYGGAATPAERETVVDIDDLDPDLT